MNSDFNTSASAHTLQQAFLKANALANKSPDTDVITVPAGNILKKGVTRGRREGYAVVISLIKTVEGDQRELAVFAADPKPKPEPVIFDVAREPGVAPAKKAAKKVVATKAPAKKKAK